MTDNIAASSRSTGIVRVPHLPAQITATRSAAGLALTLVLVIPLGLTLRHLRSTHPNFLTVYGGDTLWPIPFFILLATTFPRRSTRFLATLTFILTAAIEFSQLAHPAWLEYLRSIPLFHFFLGTTFLTSDLICLAVGTLLCVLLDLFLFKRPPSATPSASSMSPDP